LTLWICIQDSGVGGWEMVGGGVGGSTVKEAIPPRI